MQSNLARLATRQGGLFTYEQAAANLPRAQIRSNLRCGVWRRTPWRGVFVDGELPDDVPTLIRAASLWLGGDLVACHTTAALLWGFDLRSSDAVGVGDLHFLGPADLDNRRLDRLRVHPSSLGTDDAVQRCGVWCTPPARTACEVARLGRPIDTLATLDAALRSRTCSADELAAACARMRGLRGVVQLSELVPHADGRSESPMESRMRWRFLAAGLPAPQLQIEVGAGWRWHRLDLGWEEHLLAAEFDGLEAHMTREQLAADRDRHNWLTDRGWRLLHFTSAHVYQRHEEMVASARRYLNARPRPTIMAP